ncbi:hypothetical protein [Zhengella mangrovi]|uniref:hypothetical protein n=1 Tax=Zhengella mangrovi TaxID=1982044 RepID=UPI001055C671|nr:hypothetical protein [Zhengella mangrovi]
MRRQSHAAARPSLAGGLLAIALAMAAPGPAQAATASISPLPVTAAGLADRALDVLSGASRNREDRERILSILAERRVIAYDDRGILRIIDRPALDTYFEALKRQGALRTLAECADESHTEAFKKCNSGTFWRSFFDEKNHMARDDPRIDPFSNPRKGLSSAMHKALLGDYDSAQTYGVTAGELGKRGIDVLNAEARKALAAGADAMIQSLNAMTGGTSGQAVAWMEAAAEIADKASKDPAGAAKTYLESRVHAELQAQFEDKLKAAMGEKTYKSMMDKYKDYGSKQQRFEAMMRDLYTKTGDSRYKAVAELAKKASPQAIAATLAEKTKASMAGKKADAKGETSTDGKAADEAGAETGTDEDVEDDRNVREAAIILDQLEKVTGGQHPQSTEWELRFANLVRQKLQDDGVLDPHDDQHLAAFARLLALAVRHGQDSGIYQKALDDLVKLRRDVITQAEDAACQPGTDTERLAAQLGEQGFLLLKQGNRADAVRYLQQSFDLCQSVEVAQALKALREVILVLKGSLVWNQSGRTRNWTGSITLNIANGRVSGSLSVPSEVESRDAEITGEIDEKGSITARIKGVSKPLPARNTSSGGDEWMGTVSSLMIKIVADFPFEGTLSGTASADGGSGSFQAHSTDSRKESPVTISGTWTVHR